MKKIVFILLLLIVFLSSCQYSPEPNYENMYANLEEEYHQLYKELEKTNEALGKVENDIIILYDYFYYTYSDFTEKEAHDAAIELYKYLKPLYK